MTREFVHVLNLILFFRIFLSHAGGTTAAATDTIPVFTLLTNASDSHKYCTPMPPNKIQSKTFMLSLFPASYSRLPIRYTPNATSHAMPHCMITIPTACNAESISRLIAAIAATHGV